MSTVVGPSRSRRGLAATNAGQALLSYLRTGRRSVGVAGDETATIRSYGLADAGTEDSETGRFGYGRCGRPVSSSWRPTVGRSATGPIPLHTDT